MSEQKIKFNDKKVTKKVFYDPKEVIVLDSIDINKIVVSNKWKINGTSSKFFYWLFK